MADSKDIIAFGLARAQLIIENAESIARMVPLNTKDMGTPYRPVGPSEPVRQGATWEGASEFILQSGERNRRLT